MWHETTLAMPLLSNSPYSNKMRMHMNSGIVSELHQHLALVAWEFLLDTDFGRETNGMVLEAAQLALGGIDLCLLPQERQTLKSLLIDLSDTLALNMTAYGPFRRDTPVSNVGILQMVVLIAGKAAFTEKKRELAQRLLGAFASEPTAPVKATYTRIDKSTGLAMTW